MAHTEDHAARRQAFVAQELSASAEVKQRIAASCTGSILLAVDALVRALGAGKKVLLCGNGGSAADSQHLATEFVIRMNPAIKRPALPAIALSTDSSMLTAGANDIGYDNVFARAVEALGSDGDILIGISTSGKSESVIRAAAAAKKKGMTVIGLLGGEGGALKTLVDIAIVVPSPDTQRIQEGHITIGHILCGLAERELYA